MSDKTAIEWTDSTWNPVTGCTQVSPGCDNCYALTFAERWRGTPGHYFESGFDIVLRPHKLDQPLRWQKPRRIFVNSMSDLFHADVPDEFIAHVFAVMASAKQHTFQVLTKRHGRMRSLLNSSAFRKEVSSVLSDWSVYPETPDTLRQAAGKSNWYGDVWPLPNVWLGVSVEDQHWAQIRIPALLQTPAAVRFISAEPLVGPLKLCRWLPNGYGEGARWNPRPSVIDSDHPLIDWVIVGGESGHGARPMHPRWAYSLRDECVASKVPFMFKQWGEWQDGSAAPWQRGEDHIIVMDGRHERAADHWARDDRGWWTSDLIRARDRRERGTEHGTFISRVGKKAAGRELDGRTWDEFPTTREEASCAS